MFLVIGRLRANAPTACTLRTRTTLWHRYFEMLPQSSHQACANREAPLSLLPNLKNNMGKGAMTSAMKASTLLAH